MAFELGAAYLSIIPETSKIAPEIRKSLGGVESEGERAGSGLGKKFMAGAGKALKVGAIGAGVVAGGVLAGAITKGFGRLSAIEQAEAKLTGLGNSQAKVAKITQNALKSVQGTAFGLDEAATVAASSVAAGVKPGQDLERTLGLVADAATIGGSSLSEMGLIFNKVASSNKVQGDILNQLNERGIPIVQLLAKELGVTAGEVTEMSRKGTIDFATFRNAMETGLGGAALSAGNTTQGAFKNAGAALSRFGAVLLKNVFPLAKVVLGGVTTFLDDLGERAGPVLDRLSTSLTNAFQSDGVQGFIQSIRDAGPRIVEVLSRVAENGQRIGTEVGPAIRDVVSALQPLAKIVGGALVVGFVALSEAAAALAPALSSTAGFLRDNQTATSILVGALVGGLIVYKAYKIAVAAVTAVKVGYAAATYGAAGATYAAGAASKVYTIIMNGQKVATLGAAAATRVAAAGQWLLNAAMTANPIGLVVAGIALLVGGLILAYNKSGTFRNAVSTVGTALRNVAGVIISVVIRAVRLLATSFLTQAELIIKGAALAFGWIPGIGPKLRAAATKFDEFKGAILGALDKAADAAYPAGQKTGAAYAKGVNSEAPKVRAAAKSLVDLTKGEIAKGEAPVNASGKDIATSFSNGVVAGTPGAYSSGFALGQSAYKGVQDGAAGAVAAAQAVKDQVDAILSAGPTVKRDDALSKAKVKYPVGTSTARLPKTPKAPKPPTPTPPSATPISGGGGGGAESKGLSKAQEKAKRLRDSLIQFIKGDLVKSLAGGTENEINKLVDRLVTKVEKVFDGKKEARLVARLNKQRKILTADARERVRIAEDLADAEATVEKSKSLTDSVKSAAIGSLTQLRSPAEVKGYLKQRVAEITAFASNINKLKARGLPPFFLQQIIDEGLGGAPLAAALANSSGADFSAIKSGAGQLASAAASLGKTASVAMFGVGADAAQGIVNGLKAKAKTLEGTMKLLGQKMVAAIRKALRSNSPSMAMFDVGTDTADGGILGLESKYAEAEKAMAGLLAVPDATSIAPSVGASGSAGSLDHLSPEAILAAVRDGAREGVEGAKWDFDARGLARKVETGDTRRDRMVRAR